MNSCRRFKRASISLISADLSSKKLSVTSLRRNLSNRDLGASIDSCELSKFGFTLTVFEESDLLSKLVFLVVLLLSISVSLSRESKDEYLVLECFEFLDESEIFPYRDRPKLVNK